MKILPPFLNLGIYTEIQHLKRLELCFFNQSPVHTGLPVLMYIDTSKSITASAWKVQVESGMCIDFNDRCTMAIAEF